MLDIVSANNFIPLWPTRPDVCYTAPVMKHNLRQRSILVVLWLAGSAGRKQLAGLLRYVNEACTWNLRLISDPRDLNESIINEAKVRKTFDGFIGHAISESALAMSNWKIPSVLIDYPPPTLLRNGRPCSIMVDDDERIGSMAADYFTRLGRFSSFAFVPDVEQRGWSRLRERGFKQRLRRSGGKVYSFSAAHDDLTHWLCRLPKPSALLASHDFRAKDVLDACRQQKIAVPDEVSVLGIDNDEIVCDNAQPALSSIRIDHERFGYLAAAELDRVMATRKHRLPIHKILVPAVGITERNSTKFTSPGTVLVNRITDFINAHITEPIHVDDVLNHVGVSRSLANLRFRQSTGTSIRCAIEKQRLDLVKDKLLSSRIAINKISKLCGYANVQRLKYVFKKRFGCSMREWRAQHSKQTNL